MPDNQSLFQQAVQCLHQKQFQQGLTLCERFLRSQPDHTDALHVKALLAKQLNQIDLAEQCFHRSLATNRQQPSVWANLANMLKDQGRFDEAEESYQASLALSFSDPNPIKNFALMLFNQQKFTQALELLTKGVQQHPRDVSVRTLLADCYRHTEQYELALEHYNQALNINPDNIYALNNRAIVYRQLQHPEHAINDLQRLLKQTPGLAQGWFSLGCSHYDADHHEQTEQCLLRAIQLQPDYIDAHEALNKYYWERGHEQKFLQSYQQALRLRPQHEGLLYSLIAQQIGADDLTNAEKTVLKALDTGQQQHKFEHALAVIKSKQNAQADAFKLFQHVYQQQPDNIRYIIDLANYHIKQSDYDIALNLLEKARHLAPDNQEVWAYIGVCWRLTNDPRYHWLNNYEQCVYRQMLPAPQGYTDLDDFLSELNSTLAEKHTNQRQPLDQSVRGGTQTVGHLLMKQSPIIQAFRQSVEQVIDQYLTSLPQDKSHPFLQRNTGKFSLAGSWSVKLHSEGFHTNHVHPRGWLSACTYISVPEQISPNDPTHKGWIKFGETSLQLGDKEQIAQLVCPKEGLCVLFPAMFWHGTHPFQSDQPRITIPCDIMPT